MLNWIPKRKAGSREQVATRIMGLRSRCQFERLEDRAMLSATMMPAHFGHDARFPPPQLNAPHMASAAMYAAPEDFHTGPPPEMNFGRPMPGSNFGGSRGEPGRIFEPMGGTSQGGSGMSSVNPNASSIGTQALYSNSASNQAYQPTYTTIIIVMTRPSTPSFVDDYSPPPSSPILQSPPKSSSALAPSADPPQSSAIRAPAQTANDRADRGSFFTRDSIPLSSAAISIPTATQIATRDVDSAALQTFTAVDSASQSYAARLLLTTTTSTGELSLLKSHESDSTAFDETTGDFVRLSDSAVPGDAIANRDAIERERAAVDEVLRGLDDVDALPAELSWATDENNTADDPAVNESAWDTLAVSPGAFDGMVMLRATGDANDSDLDLINVAESRAGAPAERVRVETSIGFYQVMEVATDALPMTPDAPTAIPAVEPTRNAEQRAQQSENSSPKAAAAASAATLVGAMLWVSQRPRKNQAERAKSRDDRRRV